MGWKPNPFVPHGPAGPRPGQRPALFASALRLQRAIGNRRCVDVLVCEPELAPERALSAPIEPSPSGSANNFEKLFWIGLFAVLAALVWAAAIPAQKMAWAPVLAVAVGVTAFAQWRRGPGDA